MPNLIIQLLMVFLGKPSKPRVTKQALRWFFWDALIDTFDDLNYSLTYVFYVSGIRTNNSNFQNQ